MSEKSLQVLENEFPTLAGKAFSEARGRVLAAGHSVLESKNGFLIRVFPDGRSETIKQIAPTHRVKRGQVITIK